MSLLAHSTPFILIFPVWKHPESKESSLNYKGPRNPSWSWLPPAQHNPPREVALQEPLWTTHHTNKPFKIEEMGLGGNFKTRNTFLAASPIPQHRLYRYRDIKWYNLSLENTENKTKQTKIYTSEFKVKKTFLDEDIGVKALAGSLARAGAPTQASNILISHFYTLKRQK